MENAEKDWIVRKREELKSWMNDDKRRTGLSRAISAYTSAKERALSRLPELEELRKEVRGIKERSIREIDALVKVTIDSVREVRGEAYLARSAAEAKEIVSELTGSGKLVVKSKSLTGEEIGINEVLEENSNRVYETDLGEFIIQLRGEKPTHIINPSVHVPREEVAKTFSKLLGKGVSPEIPELVGVAREYLRDKFCNADIGITGANVVAANTGTIFLVENEGNARFVSNAPPKHICLTGIEKIVPTLQDAFKVLQVLPPYATGVFMSAYVSLITGPSKTADIEKTIVYGAHGPKELHLILLDNGRTRMAEDSVFVEALYCIRCGGCMYECPIYRVLGGSFGNNYFGGIGLIWSAFTTGEEGVAVAVDACTKCGRCKEVCPLGIDTPRMVERLKETLVKRGFLTPRHEEIKRNILEKGNPFGEDEARRD
ncbi:MAG: lactate utilization protein B [Candidatus Verstraetearchaeota archaeon]|nr:lactate utilization protein B [Candidatus Verstraetearchaeota archaeon]